MENLAPKMRSASALISHRHSGDNDRAFRVPHPHLPTPAGNGRTDPVVVRKGEQALHLTRAAQ